MAAPTLFTLPQHIQDAIARLADTSAAPEELRAELRDALARAPGAAGAVYGAAAAASARAEDAASEEGDAPAPPALPEAPPPLIDAELLERLAVWSASDGGRAALASHDLDPAEYSHIALVAGAHVYLPPKQRALLRSAEAEDTRAEKTNPFLPAYMSPRPASFGPEYRKVGRQLATVLNVLFSVFGLGGAAYVAATTGGGWTRAQGLLLAVVAGAVVAVADVGLIWIFSARVKKDRREASIKSIKANRGSGRAPGTEAKVLALEGEGGEEGEEKGDADAAPVDVIPAPKAEVRLRRRALGER
ncbi:hypothetical protein Q8F55_005626 [Vanrija albida]|uniref:Uncharacterized protein n=1 Tax=Vanrija albida TaxID=181172 RepID=A0ABR3Q2Q2_9TREE